MYWGFCRWEHFCENNEGMPLVFIEQTTDGHFCCNHKNNANEKEVVLRTAADTAKILKKIKELTTETYRRQYLTNQLGEKHQQWFLARSNNVPCSGLQLKPLLECFLSLNLGHDEH